MNELYISDSNKDVLRNLSEEYEEMYMVNYEDWLFWWGDNMIGRIDWMEMIVNALPDYSDVIIWSDGGTKILVKTESAANTIADLIEALYRAQGEEVLVNTGSYDPEEDKRNNEEDRYSGWWYVNID